MIKTLLDTNVLLDIALKREKFYDDSYKIFELVGNNKLKGFVSGTTITDIYYWIRRKKDKKTAFGFIK